MLDKKKIIKRLECRIEFYNEIYKKTGYKKMISKVNTALSIKLEIEEGKFDYEIATLDRIECLKLGINHCKREMDKIISSEEEYREVLVKGGVQ